ncbi:MAG: hypothetical protein V1855_00145, partial [bacterium]
MIFFGFFLGLSSVSNGIKCFKSNNSGETNIDEISIQLICQSISKGVENLLTKDGINFKEYEKYKDEEQYEILSNFCLDNETEPLLFLNFYLLHAYCFELVKSIMQKKKPIIKKK